MFAPKLIALVVDDERRIADTLRIILDNAGYTAYAAYDAEGALKQLEEVTPNLLISDVMMPGMNGVDLAIEVRKRLPECKVLLCSGVASSTQLVQEALQHGHPFQFLQKPIHPAELLRQLCTYFE